MATSTIIPSENLDINRVMIGEIRPNKAGGKTVPVKYNGQALQVRIPRIYYPAGVVVREDEKSGQRNYTMLASLKGCDSYAKERSTDGSEVGQFYNFLLDLTEKVIQHSIVNSGKWFGKTKSEPVLRETMKPILTPSVEKVNGEWVPNGKYPPSLRMKISIWDGQVGMDAVDANGGVIELTESNLEQVFAKRIEARMVITPSIYVTGTGFGVTWRVVHAKVFPPSRVGAKAAFADIKEPDEPVADKEENIDLPVTEEQDAEAHADENEPKARAATPPAAAPAAAPPTQKKRKSQAVS
uniref:Uncharacterized protein n=1 Tax=viral metagenome TaxID=1070528 RepID=A0A6C0AJG0_9ZZZZ